MASTPAFCAAAANSAFSVLGLYARHHNREACLTLLAAGADPMVRLRTSDSTTLDTAGPNESPTLMQRLDLDFQIAAADPRTRK